MNNKLVILLMVHTIVCCAGEPGKTAEPPRKRGGTGADGARPKHFPNRIWAACDFESNLPDYAWFGTAEKTSFPAYPGNLIALRGTPYKNCAAMAGINPVPGPCMGKANFMYCRYHLKGGTDAIFQHFSLTRNDNHHIRVSGLTQGKWAELTLNFTRDAARNDGSAEAFADGERMDDLKIFAGQPGRTTSCLLTTSSSLPKTRTYRPRLSPFRIV